MQGDGPSNVKLSRLVAWPASISLALTDHWAAKAWRRRITGQPDNLDNPVRQQLPLPRLLGIFHYLPLSRHTVLTVEPWVGGPRSIPSASSLIVLNILILVHYGWLE